MSVILNSQRNKRKYVDDDAFVYVLNNTNADGSIQYWTCERKTICRAKIHVSNDRIISQVGDHTHGPDRDVVKASALVTDMVQQAETTQNTTRGIISSSVCNQEEGVLAALPARPTIARRIQRARRRVNPSPPNPTSRTGFEIPQKYTVTSDGRRFLMYDSGLEDADRILIFSTDENLDAMMTNTNWFIDGTFKCAPDIYFQVYTIHVFKSGAVIPVVYALLPNKQRTTYVKLFSAINGLRRFAPTTIMTDFEMATINVVKATYPTVRVTGCFFHFGQCLFRKVQELGLWSDYQTADFNIFVRMLAALAFVPADKVIDSFDTLLEGHSPSAAQPLIDYFEDTFIGRPLRRNGRREPLIAIDIWNVCSRLDDELPKTNNSVEGWHRGFQASLSCAHPSLWKLIEHLQKEDSLQRFNIIQLQAGNVIRGRKKYRSLAARIRNIYQQYATTTTMEYLRSVAYNLRF